MQRLERVLNSDINHGSGSTPFPNEIPSFSLILPLLSNIQAQQYLLNFSLMQKHLALGFPHVGFPIREAGYLQPSPSTLIFYYVL